MTVISSEIANTSSSRCETKTTAQSAASRREITSNSRSTSLGLSEAVGSSKMIRLALSASALAISTSWRCAAERSRASASSDSERFLAEIGENFSSAPAHRRTRQPARRPKFGQEDVLEHREIGREARLLHHHRDAGVERLARRAHVERTAAIADLAAVAPDVAGDHPRQRRLAGAVGAEQRMRRARREDADSRPTSARVCAKLLEISRASAGSSPLRSSRSLRQEAGATSAPAPSIKAVRWRTRSV